MGERVFHVLTFAAGAVAGGLLVGSLRPDPHAWMLVGVMVVGGVLGGGVNYFLAKADDPAGASAARSLFVGVGAALLVPLFLHILSSNLLDLTRREPLSVLVFFGFCLVAAISSRAFITTLSDRILRRVEEVEQKAERAERKVEVTRQATEEVKSDVEEIVDNLTEAEPEPEAEAGAAADGGGFESAAPALPQPERRVLAALYGSRFARRSAGGIGGETGLGREAVVETLEGLRGRGLVAMRVGKKGHPVWSLTEAGRAFVNARHAARG